MVGLRSTRWALSAFGLSLLTACQQRPVQSPGLDSRIFHSDAPVTLCFDLRDDRHPVAGLLLQPPPSPRPVAHTVALPFHSTAATTNDDIYSRWGSYADSTLITFTSSPSTTSRYSIGLNPAFAPAPDDWGDDPSADDLYRTDSSVIFLTASNNHNLHHFIYKYPDMDPARKGWLAAMSTVADTAVDRIAVALPSKAHGIPIRYTDRSVIPDAPSGPVRFFPGRAGGPKGATPAVQLRYELPPNKAQEILLEEAGKLIGALLPPGFALFLLFFGNLDSRAKRVRWLLILCFVQLGIFALFIYLASSAWTESGAKAVGDLAIAIVSGTLAAYAVWQEKRTRDHAAT
jgi:hypothetical protein